jgi:chromate reductase
VCEGFLIATPEYNGSLSAVLKNVIDWGSRSPNAWAGKIVASCGATIGFAGTISAQQDLRKIMSRLDVTVVWPSLQLAKTEHYSF